MSTIDVNYQTRVNSNTGTGETSNVGNSLFVAFHLLIELSCGNFM